MFALAVMSSRNEKSDDRQEKINLKKEIKSYFSSSINTQNPKDKKLNQSTQPLNIESKRAETTMEKSLLS